jgi:hypothetical protein
MLQGVNEKVDKALLAEQVSFKYSASAPCELRILPTEMNPQVEQHKTQAQQRKAQGWIGRSRPAQQLVGQSVARFAPESFAVSLPTAFRRPIQVKKRLARAAIPIGFQGQMLFERRLSAPQDFRVIEYRLIITAVFFTGLSFLLSVVQNK